MNADRIAEVYYGTHGAAEQQRRARQRIHWMCAAARGQDVLDIGCSQGIASLLLGREGKLVVGVDREQQALEFAQGLLQKEEEAVKRRVRFQAAEAGDLPFEAENFDSILLGEVLEHQIDPVPVLAEARRCLRGDGVLIVTTPYGVFPYHDHKEPVYLAPLLEVLAERFTVTDVELIESYLGILGKPRRGNQRRFDPLAALRVAEARLRHQDEAVWMQRTTITKHEEAARRMEQDLHELRREAAERDQLQHHLQRERTRADDREKLALELAQLRPKAAERDQLQRELQELRPKAAQGDQLQRELQELRPKAAERDQLQRELQELRPKAAERDHAVRTLEVTQGRLRAAEADASAVNAELGRKADRVDHLESALTQHVSLTEELNRQLARHRQDLKHHEDELGARAEALTQMSARYEEAEANAEHFRALADQLTAALERRTAEATRRVTMLDEVAAEGETAIAETAVLRERIAELEERCLELASKVREQTKEIARRHAGESELSTRVRLRDTDLARVLDRERGYLRTIQDLRSKSNELHRSELPASDITTELVAPAPTSQTDTKSSNGGSGQTAQLGAAPVQGLPIETKPAKRERDLRQPPLTLAEAIVAVEERPADVRAWRSLAQAHQREKNPEAAADAALVAHELDPRSRTSIWLAARTLAVLAPDIRFGDVMDRLGPVSKLEDDALGRARDLALKARDYQRVLALCDEAQRRGAMEPEWVTDAAVAYWELGDELRAEALVEPLVALRAPDPELGAGAQYFLRINDVDRAWTTLTRMASPGREPMIDAGRRLARAGRLEEAVAAFDEVLMLAPSRAAAVKARRATMGSIAVLEDRWGAPVETTPLTSKSQRVLHLLQRTFPHHLAGSSIRTHAIGIAQLSRGLEVHMVTQPHFPWNAGVAEAAAEEVVEGIHYHRLPDPGYDAKGPLDERLQRYVDLATPLVEELRPAVLHPASTYVNALVALELGRRFDIPVVYEVRGFPEERVVAPRNSRVSIDYYYVARELERRCWARADHVITLAEVMKKHIVEHGIADDKVTVVPNAVEADVWKPLPRDPKLAADLGIPDDATLVGYISTLAPYEGIEYLLEAVGKLRAAGLIVHCLLVGGGQERRFLEQTANVLGVSDHVTFAGVVPHQNIHRYYGLMDVFVVPRTSERVCHLVTPLKPYEAMAMRRAVIVSGTTALREIVDAGRTGLCFEPENSENLAELIAGLVADPSYRAELAEAGRAWVSEHRTWSQNALLYEDVYRRLGAL